MFKEMKIKGIIQIRAEINDRSIKTRVNMNKNWYSGKTNNKIDKIQDKKWGISISLCLNKYTIYLMSTNILKNLKTQTKYISENKCNVKMTKDEAEQLNR